MTEEYFVSKAKVYCLKANSLRCFKVNYRMPRLEGETERARFGFSTFLLASITKDAKEFSTRRFCKVPNYSQLLTNSGIMFDTCYKYGTCANIEKYWDHIHKVDSIQSLLQCWVALKWHPLFELNWRFKIVNKVKYNTIYVKIQ